MDAFRKFQNVGAVCLALVIGCATGAAVDNLIVPARAGSGPTYEYSFLTLGAKEKMLDGLNQNGAQGWHIVGTAGSYIFLEREVSAP